MQLNALFPPASKPVQQYLMTNPLISGAVFAVNWSDCDKGGGRYDFTIPDAAIAPWVKGKIANLVIWAVSDSASGPFGNASTPAYLWQELGENNYTTLDTQAGFQRIPNYLSPIFIKAYQAFITALAAHYKGKVGYIRVGLGHGGETIPGAGWNNNPMFAKWGVTVSTWMQYLKTMLEFEGTLKGVQLMVGVTPMGNPSTQVPDFIASVAAPLGIGFGSQGLEASDITAAKAGKPTTADWLALFKKYPQVPHELQTIGQSCPSGTSCPGNNGLTGPLPPLLELGAANGCTDFEIYTADLLLAFDPQAAGYAQFGKAYAAALEALVK